MIYINLFNLFAKISLDDKDFKKGVNNASNSGKGLSNTLKGIGSGIGIMAGATVGLVTSAVAGVTALGGLGVKYNSEMENYLTNFDVMLGSSEKASQHLAELKDFASKTPFEMTDLAKASSTLLQFGTDVENIMPSVSMLGDISLGNSEKFSSLALVFGQVQSQGKLMGGDLLQMIEFCRVA